MVQEFKEYLDYHEKYIKSKRFFGLAPLMTRRNRDMEGNEIIVHSYDHIHPSMLLDRKTAKIIKHTTITLNELYKQKRDAVHRFVVVDGMVYLDPWFTGTRDSPLFNKCVWVDPAGLTVYEHNLVGKLVIRLGGYVTSEMKFFTSLIAKKSSEITDMESNAGLHISVEQMLEQYRAIYKRNFHLF